MTIALSEQEIASILAAAGQVKAGQKATGTPAGPYAHGPGGLFSFVTGEHPILNAMVGPKGVMSVLPVTRSDRHRTESIDTFTGVTAESGSEPEGVCDDPRLAGLKKLCQIAVPFGRQRMRSREWNVLRLAQLKDRFEEMSMGANFPIDLMNRDNLSPQVGAMGNDVSRSEIRDRMFEVAVGFQRTLCPLMYTGDPTNNTGDGSDNSGHMQTMGLDMWINQGNKRDMRSSAVCTALDSVLFNFQYEKPDSAVLDIVRYITGTVNRVVFNAVEMGLDPASWIIAMTPDLWEELSEVWPCRYLTDRCANSFVSATAVINDNANMNLRNDMRRRMYLPVGSLEIPVVPDNCIPEENWVSDAANHAPGEWSSDIYLIPMRVLGNFPATHFQYMDQRLNIREQSIAGGMPNRLWVTDGGMYLWNRTDSDLCYDLRATLEYRLIMHTPQLAARIQNVKYAPIEKFREWEPSGLYHKDGGVTSQPTEQFYNAWQTTPDLL